MDAIICGDGPMGRCAADELRDAGHAVTILGRPSSGRHHAAALAGHDVLIDFSVGDSVLGNVAAALDAGCHRLVIGTTGWSDDGPVVEALLIEHGAAAVVAPTFSPGATVLLDLAERAALATGRLGGYDPFIVEWHRAGKRDRPSGTALELARCVIGAHPEKRRVGDAVDGPAEADALEVVSLRAGAAPGTHLAGFDAAGETLELRLVARDRRAYAAGARLAAEWLLAAPRAAGSHRFTSVVRELLVTDAQHLERTIS